MYETKLTLATIFFELFKGDIFYHRGELFFLTGNEYGDLFMRRVNYASWEAVDGDWINSRWKGLKRTTPVYEETKLFFPQAIVALTNGKKIKSMCSGREFRLLHSLVTYTNGLGMTEAKFTDEEQSSIWQIIDYVVSKESKNDI